MNGLSMGYVVHTAYMARRWSPGQGDGWAWIHGSMASMTAAARALQCTAPVLPSPLLFGRAGGGNVMLINLLVFGFWRMMVRPSTAVFCLCMQNCMLACMRPLHQCWLPRSPILAPLDSDGTGDSTTSSHIYAPVKTPFRSSTVAQTPVGGNAVNTHMCAPEAPAQLLYRPPGAAYPPMQCTALCACLLLHACRSWWPPKTSHRATTSCEFRHACTTVAAHVPQPAPHACAHFHPKNTKGYAAYGIPKWSRTCPLVVWAV